MTNTLSLTAIYYKLQAGDDEAAKELWQACFLRLVTYAQKHLAGVSQRMSDPEDVALSAIASFIKAAQAGRFPNFKDRDDLWRLLLKITRNKAIDLRRYEARRKARGDSAFQSPGDEHAGIEEIPGDLSEEEFARLISDELEHKLTLLDPELTQFAVAKLEGFSNQEIAENFGVALRTVERKLHLIRRMWWELQQQDACRCG